MEPVLGGFNSTKVRLRPASAASAHGAAEFQFHKGSIKTAMKKIVKYNAKKFQFHKGSIKTLADKDALTAITVSIPQRFD